jgi:hypothetical protein
MNFGAGLGAEIYLIFCDLLINLITGLSRNVIACLVIFFLCELITLNNVDIDY